MSEDKTPKLDFYFEVIDHTDTANFSLEFDEEITYEYETVLSTLENKLKQVTGVDDVFEEDRGVFLIKSAADKETQKQNLIVELGCLGKELS